MTLTKKDAMQFPLYAGGILCGLYGFIKYLEKKSLTPLYLATWESEPANLSKALRCLWALVRKIDQKKLLKCKIDKIGLDLEVSMIFILKISR